MKQRAVGSALKLMPVPYLERKKERESVSCCFCTLLQEDVISELLQQRWEHERTSVCMMSMLWLERGEQPGFLRPLVNQPWTCLHPEFLVDKKTLVTREK